MDDLHTLDKLVEQLIESNNAKAYNVAQHIVNRLENNIANESFVKPIGGQSLEELFNELMYYIRNKDAYVTLLEINKDKNDNK